MIPPLLFACPVVVAAYWAGRARLGHRLFEWGEGRSYGARTPGWWVAQVIGLAAVTWMWTVHPRRSAANRRSWREARNVKRGPAPQYDPHWAAKRRADRPTKESP